MLIKSYLICSSAEFIITGEACQSQSGGIELIISNIKNNNGLIRVGVFNSENGYPDNPAVSFSLSKDTICSGRLRLLIPVEQPGIFGMSILDDENENGKLDYRLGIIPKEGFGFSNNPKITSRKAPPFKETCFSYTGALKEIRISIVYM